MVKTCWDCAHFRDTETEEQCFGDIPEAHDFNGRTTCCAFAWLDPRLAALERAEDYLDYLREVRASINIGADIVTNTLNIIEGAMK